MNFAVPWLIQDIKDQQWEMREGVKVLKLIRGEQNFIKHKKFVEEKLFKKFFGSTDSEILYEYALDNEHLESRFIHRVDLLAERAKDSSFMEKAWKEVPHKDWVLDMFKRKTRKYLLPNEPKVRVFPVIYGLSNPENVWKICNSGFSKLNFEDKGYGTGT